MYESFVLHPLIERLRAHPAFASADRELIVEAEAQPTYCAGPVGAGRAVAARAVARVCLELAV